MMISGLLSCTEIGSQNIQALKEMDLILLAIGNSWHRYYAANGFLL